MPTSPTEQVTDHKAEALRNLGVAVTASESARSDFFAAAVIYSNLAIAEGQERVAEELAKLGKRLDSITEFSANTQFGTGKRYLKVKP